MAIKEQAKNSRNSLQQGIYKIINPFVHLLIKLGFTPNMVTTIGFLGNVGAAGIFVYAALHSEEFKADYAPLIWAGVTVLLSSLFDMLDGQVARLGNMKTTFGAMYDSVLDRYCELVVLGGISYYLLVNGYYWGALVTFIALVGSIMVSYVRARAEGLGLECKIGFMQRPERVVVTALGTLFAGIFSSMLLLEIAMCIIALFANLTAFARINHCRKLLQGK